jgi:hypothetical protein
MNLCLSSFEKGKPLETGGRKAYRANDPRRINAGWVAKGLKDALGQGEGQIPFRHSCRIT